MASGRSADEKLRNPPSPVKILSIILLLLGCFAFFGSVFLWGKGFILSFPRGADYGFPAADILVNTPACLIASVGLWRLRKYGYVAAQFVAGFAVYASVEIFALAAQGSLPVTAGIILPQVLAVIVSFCLVFYLWRVHNIFR